MQWRPRSLRYCVAELTWGSIRRRLLDRSMREAENIGPGIVACHIQVHALTVDHGKIKVSNDELLAIVNGFDNVTPIRPDNRASSTLNPRLLNVVGQLGWNIGCPHHQADRKYKASSLEGIVSARELCHLVHRGPNRYVNLLSSLMHCHPRQRHPVFPADEASNACLGNIHGCQTSAISRPPHKTFGESWDEFGMMVCHSTIR